MLVRIPTYLSRLIFTQLIPDFDYYNRYSVVFSMDSGEVGKDPLNNNRRVSYVEVFL